MLLPKEVALFLTYGESFVLERIQGFLIDAIMPF